METKQKAHVKREADLQGKFGRWLRSEAGGEVFPFACAFELKAKEAGESIAFDAVAVHQAAALEAASEYGEGVYYKLTDLSLGRKPFDCFWLKNAHAFVVVGWRHSDGWHVYGVDIEDWQEIADTFAKEGRKSIKEAEIEEKAGGFEIALL